MATNNKHGLGRGLGALLGDDDLGLNVVNITPQEKSGIKSVRISDIQAGQFQPRRYFDEEAIDSLAESIKEQGILQPILVRSRAGGKYEIIAGERRFRAAKKAGLTEIPVIEKNLADNEVLEVALVENIVRRDLSPLEEAAGFDRLLKEFTYTQEKLSKVVVKSRSYIANSLRLLSLPKEIKKLINQRKISAGHARCLIGLENAVEIAHRIVEEGLSVRQVEFLVCNLKKPVEKKIRPVKDRELVEIEKSLSQKFSLKVQINAGKNGKGRVILNYNDFSQLESIIDKLEQRG